MIILAYTQRDVLTEEQAKKLADKLIRKLKVLDERGDPRAQQLTLLVNEYVTNIEKKALDKAKNKLLEIADVLRLTPDEGDKKPKSLWRRALRKLKKALRSIFSRLERGLTKITSLYYTIIRPFALVVRALGQKGESAARLLERTAVNLPKDVKQAEREAKRHSSNCAQKLLDVLKNNFARKVAYYYYHGLMEMAGQKRPSPALMQEIMNAENRLRGLGLSTGEPEPLRLVIPEECKDVDALKKAAEALNIYSIGETWEETVEGIDQALEEQAQVTANEQLLKFLSYAQGHVVTASTINNVKKIIDLLTIIPRKVPEKIGYVYGVLKEISVFLQRKTTKLEKIYNWLKMAITAPEKANQILERKYGELLAKLNKTRFLRWTKGFAKLLATLGTIARQTTKLLDLFFGLVGLVTVFLRFIVGKLTAKEALKEAKAIILGHPPSSCPPQCISAVRAVIITYAKNYLRYLITPLTQHENAVIQQMATRRLQDLGGPLKEKPELDTSLLLAYCPNAGCVYEGLRDLGLKVNEGYDLSAALTLLQKDLEKKLLRNFEERPRDILEGTISLEKLVGD